MTKVPPQFAKKSVDTRGKGKTQPGSKSPVDAPNAGQDEALAVTRNALLGPKKTSAKGMPKGKPC